MASDTSCLTRKRSHDYLFKLLLTGDSGVGKVQLIDTCLDGPFGSDVLVSTFGCDSKIKTTRIGDATVKLQLWNTAGQERFHTGISTYYRGVNGIMVVYDITNRRSFENSKCWMQDIQRFASPEVVAVLVGNNVDNGDGREVPTERGREFAEKHGVLFYEVSSKCGTNVEEAFTALAAAMLAKARPAEAIEHQAAELSHGRTFGDRMKGNFKSKHDKPPEMSPKVQEKPQLVEVSNYRGDVGKRMKPPKTSPRVQEKPYLVEIYIRGDDDKRTKPPKTSPKAGEKTSVAEPVAVSKSESPADGSPEKYSRMDEVQLENDRLQGQCMRLFEHLQQEREEKNELEEQNRETCSRLEQQRNESVRMREELTQQVARLEERLSDAQKLQATTQGQCTRLFDQLQQEREAKNEFEKQNREMCSRLEQQRDESVRMREELKQQVAHLEERLSEAQKLQSATQPSTMEIEFWEVSRHDIQVVSDIGVGAWGCVAKGVFRGQEVAVKWPHRALLDPQGRTVERLRREVQIMAQVRHPNLLLFIAAVFDEQTRRLAEPPLIVTELLAMNLRAAYQQSLLGSSRMSIYRDIACALNYLHLRCEPIIHRDVSAPNVLLEERRSGRWKAKLADFGSANLARFAQTMGEGAIIYAPPETIPSLMYDTESPEVPQTTKIDVYSYGVLLCEVSTSQFPDPEQYRSMMEQVKGQSPFVHRLIVSCMKRSPSDRPTMAQIITGLDKQT